MMMLKHLLPFLAACLLLLTSCIGGGGTKKSKKLDRTILGEELAFGRDAAEFELWNEAIFRWEKVVTADPTNSEALNNLAVAYESTGNYEKARELYKEALEYDEDSSDIRKNYKRFLSFYKRHQRQLAREKKVRQTKKERAAAAKAEAEAEAKPAKEQDEDQGGSF